MSAEMFSKDTMKMLCDIYHGTEKKRVETDFGLPDYKEEAGRILRVDAKPRITGKNVFPDGQFVICEVDGIILFNVTYLAETHGEEKKLSSYAVQEDFHHVFKAQKPFGEDGLESFLSFCEAECEAVSSKLYGPRKIGIKCDIVLSLDLKANREVLFYSSSLAEDSEVNFARGEVARIENLAEEDFEISHTISLPREYLAIGEIHDMDITLFAQKPALSDGKLHFSGICNVFCSYSSEEGELVSFYQPIEFEEETDFEGEGEATNLEVTLVPNLLKAVPDLNDDGENKIIHLEAGFTAQITSICNEEKAFCIDHFSTTEDVKNAYEELSTQRLAALFDSSSEIRSDFQLKQEGVIRCEGIKAFVDFRNSYLEENRVVCECKVKLSFIGVKSDGSFCGVEETLDLKFNPDGVDGLDVIDPGVTKIELCGGARSCDIDMIDGKASLRLEIFCHGRILCRDRYHIVSSITSLGPLPEREKEMIFFYPEKDETLWDIAKKYKVPLSLLREENDIEGEEVPDVIRIF